VTLPDNPESLCFDANVFIDFLESSGSHQIIGSLLRHAEVGHFELHMSALCFLEVRGWPSKAYDDDRDRIALDLITRPYCVEIEFNRAVGQIARKLLAKHSWLSNFDAGQIASAVHAGSDVFMTGDQQLQAIGRFEGVHIAEPYLPNGLPQLIVQDRLEGLE
jgi:predicted nucleic acid-binding protein